MSSRSQTQVVEGVTDRSNQKSEKFFINFDQNGEKKNKVSKLHEIKEVEGEHK